MLYSADTLKSGSSRASSPTKEGGDKPAKAESIDPLTVEPNEAKEQVSKEAKKDGDSSLGGKPGTAKVGVDNEAKSAKSAKSSRTSRNSSTASTGRASIPILTPTNRARSPAANIRHNSANPHHKAAGASAHSAGTIPIPMANHHRNSSAGYPNAMGTPGGSLSQSQLLSTGAVSGSRRPSISDIVDTQSDSVFLTNTNTSNSSSRSRHGSFSTAVPLLNSSTSPRSTVSYLSPKFNSISRGSVSDNFSLNGVPKTPQSTEEVFDLMEKEQDAIVLKLMREIALLKEENKQLRHKLANYSLTKLNSANSVNSVGSVNSAYSINSSASSSRRNSVVSASDYDNSLSSQRNSANFIAQPRRSFELSREKKPRNLSLNASRADGNDSGNADVDESNLETELSSLSLKLD